MSETKQLELLLHKFAEQFHRRFDNIETRLNTLANHFDTLDTTLNRIEAAQNDGIISTLKHVDTKLTDVKHVVAGLKYDIEFTVKEQALLKLEVDRIQRKPTTDYFKTLDVINPRPDL